MTGLLMFIGNMGGLLSAAPLALVVAHTSWRYVFVAAGAISILLAVLTWLFLRDNPHDLGLPSMQQLEGKPEYPPGDGNWREALKTVLANRRTWPGFFSHFGLIGAYLSWGGLWAIPYLHETQGMERQLAAWHTSLMIVCFALASLAVGALSDRIGRRTPLMRWLGFVYVLCWLPLLWADSCPWRYRWLVCAHGNVDQRRHAGLGLRQGSQPAGLFRHLHQRGQYRRISRPGPVAAADGSGARLVQPRRGAQRG